MREDLRWIGISALLVVLFISILSFLDMGDAPTGMVSLMAVFGKTTGNVVGLNACVASFKITSPEGVTVYPGASTSIDVDITDVKCGFTQASLALADFPKELYSVTPAQFSSLAPTVKKYTFAITFDMPAGSGGRIYYTKPRITTSSSTFSGKAMTVTVEAQPEKPALTAGAPVIKGLETTDAEESPVSFFSSGTWWKMALIAVVFALSLVIYEFAPVSRKKR